MFTEIGDNRNNKILHMVCSYDRLDTPVFPSATRKDLTCLIAFLNAIYLKPIQTLFTIQQNYVNASSYMDMMDFLPFPFFPIIVLTTEQRSLLRQLVFTTHSLCTSHCYISWRSRLEIPRWTQTNFGSYHFLHHFHLNSRLQQKLAQLR